MPSQIFNNFQLLHKTMDLQWVSRLSRNISGSARPGRHQTLILPFIGLPLCTQVHAP